MIVPRYYQSEAIDSVFRYFGSGKVGNPVVAMPTGTGKSIVIGLFAKQVMQTYPGQRLMCVTHVKELITQNHGKVQHVWPTAPAGVYSAGLKKRDTDFPLTFAGIQSVHRNPDDFGRVDLLLIDECHLVSPNQDTMYGAFIKGLRKRNPHTKVIGLSATPFRTKHGLLTDGPLFTDVCYDNTDVAGFNKLVREGYLCAPRTIQTGQSIDTDGLHVRMGEFIQKELEERLQGGVTRRIVDESIRLGEDRNRWLVYANSIEHADAMSELYQQRGYDVPALHSKVQDRDQLMADFKAGKYRGLVSRDMLTTGVDVPEVDYIVVARATRSPGLWIQIVGRGTRPHPSKRDCLVADFGGNIERLGPINDPVLPSKRPKKDGGGVPPVKVCPSCASYVPAAARTCEHCGADFPPGPIKLNSRASGGPVLREDPETKWLDVDRVTYKRHTKKGKPDSLCVTYFCGYTMVREWICPAHGGLASRKARAWWKRRTGEPCPPDVDRMLGQLKHLATPSEIRALVNIKYPEIKDYRFQEKAKSS